MTYRPAFARSPNNHLSGKKQGRRLMRCPKSMTRMFFRVYMAEGYAPTCKALYSLAMELFRRGNTLYAVSHDLNAMRRDLGLIVEEVVLAAWERARA